jgi:hypothetical protein
MLIIQLEMYIQHISNIYSLSFAEILTKVKHNNYELYYKRSAQKDFYTILVHKR